MSDLRFTPLLSDLGLTDDQARIYEIGLQSGPLTARELATQAGLSRTLGYAVLEQLVVQGLFEKNDASAVTRFVARPPSRLSERLTDQKSALERSESALKTALPELSSLYNLATGKPGVQFFEGLGGIEAVLEDTLTAKETIYSYADLEMIEKYIPEINRAYVKKRERLGLKKKALLLDTEENRFLLEGYHVKITDVKLIKASAEPFKTVMQIYDGRISYFTLGKEQLVGIIITDPSIFEMHKSLFDTLYESPLALSL